MDREKKFGVVARYDEVFGRLLDKEVYYIIVNHSNTLFHTRSQAAGSDNSERPTNDNTADSLHYEYLL